jgi:hypothetical protein
LKILIKLSKGKNMKRLIISMFVIAGLLLSSAYAQEAQKKTLGAPKPATEKKVEPKKEIPAPKTDAKTKAKGAKPTKGTVVALAKLIGKGDGKVTKDEAIKLAEAGSPIVFMDAKGKVFFIFNADGTFAGKKLANYANNKAIGIVGKAVTLKGGFKGIIADLIESME